MSDNLNELKEKHATEALKCACPFCGFDMNFIEKCEGDELHSKTSWSCLRSCPVSIVYVLMDI